MPKAYDLTAPDCDCHYFAQAQANWFCSSCDSYVRSEPYYPTELAIDSLKYDFCFTYENRLLLSATARAFLEEHASNIGFAQINHDPAIFVPIVTSVVTFDTVRRHTKFENLCDTCGQYQSVVGATPPYLKDPGLVQPNGFYRTDVEFGSGREKAPSFIVGENLKRFLEQRFEELYFHEVRRS